MVLGQVEGCEVGEAILKDDRVLIPFKRAEPYEVEKAIGWDCNELSIDGFSPELGFVRIDLRPLITARITYHENAGGSSATEERKKERGSGRSTLTGKGTGAKTSRGSWRRS